MALEVENLTDRDWDALLAIAAAHPDGVDFRIPRLEDMWLVWWDGRRTTVTHSGVSTLLRPPVDEEGKQRQRPRLVPCLSCGKKWDAYEWPRCQCEPLRENRQV